MVKLEIPFYPHEKQIPFMASETKFRAVITGIGFGKSSVGVVEMIKDCIEHPGVMNLIYAPTFPMLKNATMVEFWKFCPKELVAKHNKSEHLIYFINGSVIIYLSGDNQRNIDRIRGLNLGSAYGDEIALSPSYVWKIIVGRLRDPRGSRRAWLTTTPKGFNWVYDWFVEKKHTSNPSEYEWFGGSSLDNPYTPQDYKDSLESTYSGAFYKQELLGEFVGYEGLVYSEFSRNVHVGDFSKKNFEEYVGGLDWGWTNPNVAILTGKDGDGRYYILKEVYVRRTHNDEFCGLVKGMIKEKKEVVFQADPSEPAFIDAFNNKELITEAANNEILPGIQKVASLLKLQKDKRPRLFVDESCVNTIMEFENYRYPDVEEGKPERDLPIKVHDHCLVADTKILTSKGEINLIDVKKGDYVLTREGWKEVKWSGQTGKNSSLYEVSLSDGRTIVCTAEHPFFVEGKGWVLADALRYNYKLVDSLRYLWRQEYLMEIDTIKEKKATGEKQGGFTTYTETYGNRKEEIYQMVSKSTIKMATKITTKYSISNAYPLKNTLADTLENMILHISTESDLLLKNGMLVKKEENGIKNIGRTILRSVLKKSLMFVNNVEKIMSQEQLITNQSFAIRIANREPSIVGVRKLEKKLPVYNLEVNGLPEFFANGILVHNSMDCIRYMVMGEGKEVAFGFLEV